MDLTDVLLAHVHHAHRWLEMAIDNVTPEMLAWQPPAAANPIGAVYQHAVGTEDWFIHPLFQQKPTVWDSGGWGAKLGFESQSRQWDALKAFVVDLPAFRSYMQAVFDASKAYVAGLTPLDLDQPVPFMGREWKMGDVLMIMGTHTATHAGEIAALKGMQGAKGLPF